MSRSASIRMDTQPAELARYPFDELRRRARPGDPRQLASVQRDHDARNAAHREALGERRLLVDIDLDQPRLGLERRGGAFEFGRHRLARAAPGGPKIDDQWHVALFEEAFDAGGVERHRMAVEQRLVPV